MLVKILGGLDLLAAVTLFSIIFGISPPTQLLVFCGILILVKGLFVLTGDLLSVIDLLAAVAIFLSIFAVLPSIVLWAISFILMAKGIVSFF